MLSSSVTEDNCIKGFGFKLEGLNDRTVRHRMLACPLITDAFYILVSFRIAQYGMRIGIKIRRPFPNPLIPRLRRIDGSQPDFGIQSMLLEGGSQIIRMIPCLKSTSCLLFPQRYPHEYIKMSQ